MKELGHNPPVKFMREGKVLEEELYCGQNARAFRASFLELIEDMERVRDNMFKNPSKKWSAEMFGVYLEEMAKAGRRSIGEVKP